MDDRREHWNKVHKAQDRDALSASDPAETLRHHGLADYLKSGMTVLDIGVGVGNSVRYYKELGCTVDCLDVADVAAATVAPWARSFYTAKGIHMLPAEEYDLALSHLTAQHMTDADLREQIRYVSSALKRGGVFSLHLAGSHIPGEDNLRGPIPDGFDGRMCRSPEYALEMVRDAVSVSYGQHYSVSLTDNVIEWPQFKSYWFFLYVRREE